jgi:hypothetical protein
MSDKELYQQKMRAQLDEWKAEVDMFKAKASRTSADARLKMNKHIEMLESKIEEGKTKLSELSSAGEDTWESLKEGVESTWDSMKSAVSDAAAKFKD